MIGKTAKTISKMAIATYIILLGSPILIIIAALARHPYFSRAKSRTSKVIMVLCLAIVTALLTYAVIYIANTPMEAPDQPSNQAIIFVNSGWKNMVSTPPDYALAMRNNRSGYKLNHPEGAANIGLLYEKGWGVPVNYVEAAIWYKEAIAMGAFRSVQADYQLAGLYENGLGVKKDRTLAIGHYSVALKISTGSGHSLFINEGSAKLARDALDRLNIKQ